MNIWVKIGKITLNVILVFLFLIGMIVLISLLPINGNIKILSVSSGSMSPAIPVGSSIVVRPVSEYRVGDIVTFVYEPNGDKTKKEDKELVTHRIVEIKDSTGLPNYITKGDANSTPDNGQVRPEQIVGKELFAIPLLGYLLSYVKTLPGLILVIVIPAIIIIFEEINNIRKETKNIIQKRIEDAMKKENKTNRKRANKTPTIKKEKKQSNKNKKPLKKGGKNVKKK